MPELTGAQKSRQEKRARQAQAITEGKTAAPDKPATPKPFPFAHMIASGNPVTLGDLTVQIAPFVLSRLPQAGTLLGQCPDALVMHALANRDVAEFDVTRTADLFTQTVARTDPDAVPTPPEWVHSLLAGIGGHVSEQETEAMIGLVHLAALRRHPDLTRDQIDEGLTIPAFLQALRVILQENPNLADPF